MAFEEVEHFFSECGEFEITKHDEVGTLKINLKCTKSVDYDDNMEPAYNYHDIYTLVYKPTIQTLIRTIENLGYRKHIECP